MFLWAKKQFLGMSPNEASVECVNSVETKLDLTADVWFALMNWMNWTNWISLATWIFASPHSVRTPLYTHHTSTHNPLLYMSNTEYSPIKMKTNQHIDSLLFVRQNNNNIHTLYAWPHVLCRDTVNPCELYIKTFVRRVLVIYCAVQQHRICASIWFSHQSGGG